MRRTFALSCLLILTANTTAYSPPEVENDESTGYNLVDENSYYPITLLTLSNSTIIGLTADNLTISTDTTNSISVKPPVKHRIVGGRQISIREAPWQVAVIMETTFICGGSLISTHWVLTAAHCVYGNVNSRFAARAGSDYFKQGGQLRIAERVFHHSGYNPRNVANDIALLRMRRGFNFNSRVRAIKIPTYEAWPGSYSISGWGTLSENSYQPSVRLRGVNVRPVSRTTCSRAYRGTITSSMICASAPRQDSCQGDSGGALWSRGKQYGIVSFGQGCARSRYPGVYTSVPRYRKWILSVVRGYGPRNDARFIEYY